MFALLVLAAHSWAEGTLSGPKDTTIRIGIAQKADSLPLKTRGRVRIVDGEDGPRGELAPDKVYTLSGTSRGLKLGGLRLSREVRLEPAATKDTVEMHGQSYHGRLILKLEPNATVTVVEELGIEDYLRGVLPHEMDPSWPKEALKAQAVVARTFAYAHMGKYRSAGFDLTPDTRSQVYRGLGTDWASIRGAVEETRGEVLGFKGELLTVFYHACCGGRTSDSGEVWNSGSSPPPLRGVKDRLCRLSPHYRWTAFISEAQVLNAVQTNRVHGARLSSVKILRRDRNGLAKTVRFDIEGMETTLTPAEIRKRLGSGVLKSPYIREAVRRKGQVEFRGQGSGHGVGLCQWGARLQAENGRSYENILKYFFPQSVLSLVDR